uniref:DEAD-box RNA helicase Q domain-containing protein n=1 Tax=Aegilops tauschii subsp. strangulata TaxID=200361 RepID=A0A453H9N6_AEGTS
KKGLTKTTPIQREAIPLILVNDFCLKLLLAFSLARSGGV